MTDEIKRNASDVLRDIDSTKKKIKRYKSLRRTLKSTMTASAPLIAAGVFGLPPFNIVSTIAAAVLFVAASAVLANMTFREQYGFRYAETGGGYYRRQQRIEGSGLNVFDHLDRKLGELQDELAAASTA